MNWGNVKLIFQREVRDQLRDRRTLFMIAVLPIVLYPLLGMSFLQVAQFVRERPTRIVVVGLPQLPDLPPLVAKDQFDPSLFSKPEKARLLKVDLIDRLPGTADSPPGEAALAPDALPTNDPQSAEAQAARREMRRTQSEAVVVFPADFAERLTDFRARLVGDDAAHSGSPVVPGPEIYYNSAKESSQVAQQRTSEVLGRWLDAVGRQNLEQSHVLASAAKPFAVQSADVAEAGHRKGAMWSKILPFVLLLWALTGAFYPAVDLCAGEKERGTLETLLSSPAERSEIVWGKLLTVMLFSMATALLNLLSMGITGMLVVGQQVDFGPPPLLSIVWLLVALVPMSALFSGLCLALAAFARSSKEGQYYLMPLVLITMPLTILPMSPGFELNLGNSLIPVTGVVLLLRTLLEGNYALAMSLAPPVIAVTLVCCLLAVRWAADQFDRESVLFRESERFDMGLWLRHLMRDREDTPSVAEAVFCGMLILIIRFFMGFAFSKISSFDDFVAIALKTQLVVILTPALLMAVMLTRKPVQTLLLRRPPLAAIPAAVLLAVCLHPLVYVLNGLVQRIYPLNEEIAAELQGLLTGGTPGVLILVLGLVPAICEEIAFRGFILSGFRHLGHKWRAIVLSSIFFGVSHAVFQQSLLATVLGLFIGFLAVQTGSLYPCILFHFSHNSLQVLASQFLPDMIKSDSGLSWLARAAEGGGYEFRWPVLLASAVASTLLLFWFKRLPYARTAEEALQEAIEQQAAPTALAS